MNKTKLAVILAVTLVFLSGGLTACNNRNTAYPVEVYCVDAYGHVYPDTYCDGHHLGYGYWSGNTHNHHYVTGAVIPNRYYRAGTTVTREAVKSQQASRSAARASRVGAAKSAVKSAAKAAKQKTSSVLGGSTRSGKSKGK